MNKETFWVVFSGFVVGLAVVFFVYRFHYKKKALIVIEQVENAKGSVLDINQQLAIQNETLIISFPEDQSISETTSLIVMGTAPINSWVIIFVNGKENFQKSDEMGNFSLDVKLEFGSNVVKVNSFDQKGQPLEDEITIICSTNTLEEKLVSDEEVADQAKIEKDKK